MWNISYTNMEINKDKELKIENKTWNKITKEKQADRLTKYL